MPPEPTAPVAPAASPLPAAPKKTAPVFTPAAAHISARPREKFLETVKNYTFAGNPKPELVDEVKRIALVLAEIAPCDKADMLEARIEISGYSAHQVLVQVSPHSY